MRLVRAGEVGAWERLGIKVCPRVGLLHIGGHLRLRQLLRAERVCTMIAEEAVRFHG